MTIGRIARRTCTLATVVLVGAMVIAAYFHNELRAQNWDPMQTRVYVERTLRYGGTFYENGLVNKGPVEPMVYRLATAVTSWDGFWYAISALIIVVSGVLAWAASATTRRFADGGGPGARLLGVAVGVVVFFHFTLGKADYAGVLYSRNMIIGLYAGALLIAVSPRWWFPRRAQWAAAVVGVLLGLGMQTLFTSAIAACGVWLIARSQVDAIHGLANEPRYRRCRRILAITPIAVFVSTPTYYLLRGRFDEFWDSYWTYNKYQNIATGRSLANQLVYGRDAILRYYRAWPVSLLIVIAFVAMTVLVWRTLNRRDRMVHVGLSVWFVGAWTELVLSQRYSSHYFSVLALPTALMAATVIGHVHRLAVRERGDRRFRTAVAWPVIAGLLAIAAWGGQHLTLGLQAASSYTGVHANAVARAKNEPGPQRTARAVLDLVSDPGDPLLAWTEYPWTYLNLHRVAATRWIWKSFMLGQVYLGRASSAYVLPRTWEWFADDMREARPAAFLEETALPVSQGNPFAMYVNDNFERVFEGATYNIYLRHDEAAAVLRGDAGDEFDPVALLGAGGAWQLEPGSAVRDASAPSVAGDLLVLNSSLCTRISGTYTATSGAAPTFLSFLFDRPGAIGSPTGRLNIAGGTVFSGNEGAVFESTNLDPQAVADADTAASLPADDDPVVPATATPQTHDFAVVVGARSAALVIDGRIGAAVRLDGQTRVSLEVRGGGVEITDLRRGGPPPDAGCD